VKAQTVALALASTDHRRKLARSEVHLHEVEKLIKGWVKPGSYKIAMESDGNGGLELAGTQLKPLPDSLGLVIGDCLQAMRSSLDNLAFGLSAKHTPVMTPQQEGDISFPIGDGPPALNSQRIRLMSDPAQAAIVALCPDPTVAPVQDHPLWLLNKANNRDKHRAITVAAADVSNYNLNLPKAIINSPSRIGIAGPHRTQKVGDRNIFATFGPGSQVQANLSTTLQVVFGQGVEVSDREVIATLWWFHDHIRDTVFQALEPHI
jgi:hypothetical protein